VNRGIIIVPTEGETTTAFIHLQESELLFCTVLAHTCCRTAFFTLSVGAVGVLYVIAPAGGMYVGSMGPMMPAVGSLFGPPIRIARLLGFSLKPPLLLGAE